MSREQRLVFGEVADLYDRYRPAYPERLVDDLVMLAGLGTDQAVLEVGAGTGKATAMFAARGFPVVAVDPSAEMLAVARRKLAARRVEFEQGDFETWDPAGRRFPLVLSAQAWHWVDPSIGYAKACSVLEIGGLLAAFWNRPDWAKAPARELLVAAYERAVPELTPESDPMHPGGRLGDDDGEWEAQISATEGLANAEVRDYRWSETSTAEQYAGGLATRSSIRLLDTPLQQALINSVRAAIEESGGSLVVPQLTVLCLAQRTR